MSHILDGITDFIFVEHKPSKADIILVPGGSYPAIIQQACDLFLAGYAPYILPSGGFNPRLPPNQTEFDFFQGIALNRGIEKERILKEDKATHTLENALFSQEVIKEQGIQVDKAILVCKNYHARRALMTYQYVFGKSIQFLMIPTGDERNIHQHNWFMHTASRNLVLNELVKIGQYFQRLTYNLENLES